MITRVQIQVRGIVQGVGFRPFVYSLARKHSLKGHVLNNETGVLIDVEANQESLDSFVSELQTAAPTLAHIESLQRQDGLPLADYSDFQILESTSAGQKFVPISPDLAVCDDCLRELFDPSDRRYRYPFINCTNCGPRFTIIEDVPYDRSQTTMREFVMCDECRLEYQDPDNRRFHAEPTACTECGPQVSLLEASSDMPVAGAEEAIRQTIGLLTGGQIVAIKGIGGFHLACDALNEEAVTTLRRRKYREDKPFALLARTTDIVREYCAVSDAEAELLGSLARPIVLLQRRARSRIADAVAPRVNSLGFMLPYTPLHYLLLEHTESPLVMTSANISDEPICYQDDEARKRLSQIADWYLLNDRRIHMRTDDSVVRVQEWNSVSPGKSEAPKKGERNARGFNRSDLADQPMVLRRARGYAPLPLKTGFKFGRQILACGAELKNTFCLTRGDYAFVSHHIGDLENLETFRSFTEGIEHYKRLFYLKPEVVAYDLHPEYLSTKYALAHDCEIKLGIQHHHAHIASCMVDNQIDGEVIGVAMDGLGFGTDERLWGGEFFVANFVAAERVAHLEYLPLPGGARAIREPWRMAAVYLQETFGDDFLKLDLPFVADLDTRTWTTLKQMIASGTNSPETSSMGRLFDAVASLLRLRDRTNYEGQAAVELEQIADRNCRERYKFELSEDGSIIRTRKLIHCAAADILDGVPPRNISAKFHLGVADLITAMSQRIRSERKLNRVVLSGGVFQNLFLLRAVCEMLAGEGFEVFTHSRVPANDGGISLGQAAIASART